MTAAFEAHGDCCDVSVVLSTYNRADRLALALDALLSQTGGVSYEIIVVDNNSSDETAAVVAQIAGRSNGRLRYEFEPRQGLSHGRNPVSHGRGRQSSRSQTTMCASHPTG